MPASKATHLMMIGLRNARNIRSDDFYFSPSEAVIVLCNVERLVGPIWEPACGDGEISGLLAGCGHDVVSTDPAPRGSRSYPEPWGNYRTGHLRPESLL
jgi:hypothetical protein